MKQRNKGIEIACSVVFIICAILCLAWFVLYAYLAVPEITLNGEEEITVNLNGSYEEQGATAKLDNKDVTDRIKIDNPLNTNKVGDYIIKYSITNTKGQKEQVVTRRVKVRETEKPIIVLNNKSSITVQYGSKYKEPGYKANDNYDGDLTDRVEVQGEVDTRQIGTYKLYYTATDSSENSVTVVRTVKVIDTKGPKLTLNGKSYTVVSLNGTYKEKGCKAIDAHDGDISDKVKSSGQVNTRVAGYYTVNYTVKDSFGNTSNISRKVQVGTQTDIDNANHILISISEQRLWFYQNGILQLSANVVTGTRGVNDTPRGSFRIQGKAQSIYLRGPDYESFVNYWMPIYGDIGMHDASWRSTFGGYIYQTSGSHGCINLPYYVAENLYYNAPIGMLVKII